jgi:hypothetical protein
LNAHVINQGAAEGEYPQQLMNTNTPTQIDGNDFFSLDGDSMILASSRPEPPANNPVIVAKVSHAHGAIGSPIVVGPRKLTDDEFWDFLPTDDLDHDPTSGFIRIGYAGDSLCTNAPSCGVRVINVLRSLPNRPDKEWGVVVKLNPDAQFDIGAAFDPNNPTPVAIPAGTTIRGDRRGTNPGPLLTSGECFVSDADVKDCSGWFFL